MTEKNFNHMKIAAFTNVRNEPVLLPLWLEHYSKHADDLYVLDNGTNDGSVEEAKKKFTFTHVTDRVVPFVDEFGLVSNGTMARDVAKQFQSELLEKYDWVIHAHVDEFIFVNPKRYKNIADFLSETKKEVIYVTSYQLLQVEGELDMDFKKPMLSQRKYWTNYHGYNKPLIARRPCNWVVGIHKEQDVDDDSLKLLCDTSLHMAHVHFADLNLFNKRSRYAQNMDWFNKFHPEKEEIPKWAKNIV